MMKSTYTSYSDLLHIVHGRCKNISFPDPELRILDREIWQCKKVLGDIFVEYCRTKRFTSNFYTLDNIFGNLHGTESPAVLDVSSFALYILHINTSFCRNSRRMKTKMEENDDGRQLCCKDDMTRLVVHIYIYIYRKSTPEAHGEPRISPVVLLLRDFMLYRILRNQCF